MSNITAEHIVAYATCPKRCWFSWEQQYQKEQNLFADVVKRVYLHHIRKMKLAPWRDIRFWAEDALLKALPFTDPDEVYAQGKNLLGKLSIWYNKYEEEYCDPGIVNVPVFIGLGSSLTLTDTVDLITMNEKIRVFDFDEVRDKESLRSYNGLKIYNDLKAMVHVWGLQTAGEIVPDEYVRIVVGVQSVRFVSITLTPEYKEKARRFITHITRGMRDGAFYPSFSEQCFRCPFKARCSI